MSEIDYTQQKGIYSMKHQIARLITILCLGSGLAGFSFAQSTSEVATSTAPVAFVYVSSSPLNNGYYQINGFAAAPSGSLTAISGSPFAGNVREMAVNGQYLFGADTNLGTFSISIDSFSIASDGSLTPVSSVTAGEQGDGLGVLFLDHTGSSLYNALYESQDGSDIYQSYSVNPSTGVLTFLGETGTSTQFGFRLSLTADNLFAYGANCNGSTAFIPDIFGFARASDQTLSQLNISPKIPQAPNGEFYCPFLAVADTTNHVAISLQPIASSGNPPAQLATYSEDQTGNLTTTSTASNMPKVATNGINTMWMSPSGNLLAVGGAAGLQVFHFNGANPITNYTGLLTKDPITQVFWDNNNHLYALSSGTSSGKLYVFTVTPTSHWQAPGSPYSITNPYWPDGLIVLPR